MNHDVDHGSGADQNDDDDDEGKGAGDDVMTAGTRLISARPAPPLPRPGHDTSVQAPCAHVQGNKCSATCYLHGHASP